MGGVIGVVCCVMCEPAGAERSCRHSFHVCLMTCPCVSDIGVGSALACFARRATATMTAT